MDSVMSTWTKNTLDEYMNTSVFDNLHRMLGQGPRVEDLNQVEKWSINLPTVEDNRVTRSKKYDELSAAKKIQADCFAVPVFSPGDDPIAYFNKTMAFQTVGRQGQGYSSIGYKSNATSSGGNNSGRQARVVKCYNYQGEGHMARKCTQPKRPRNAAWYKDKAMLVEAREAGQILDEEQLAFLADSVVQTTVLMANLSNYSSDVISKVPRHEPYHTDMDNQSVHTMQGFEQTPVVDFTDNEITSDSNIIPYAQYLQETQQAVVQDTNLYA
ncbi:retrovirus-related pol polyprotein from transposon TNT 1-94 [Tanacetum coccineum]|uniref:Retrovirus-related pol polyprotein from transposon TNT 1-94 n=1 Tax=Tanacetum coccineum TaxID=301880 RepID=A0ABQ5GTV7_9ASTR